MLTSKKEKIDYFEAIQLISLSNLYNLRADKATSREYDFNRIFRSYSVKFHTPLYQVLQLPIHHVLTAYFDDLFESMDPDQIDEVREDLLKSAEEREADREAADSDEVELDEVLNNVAKEAQAMATKVEAMVKSGTKPLINNKGEVPLENPLVQQKKPDIKMTFLSEAQMQEQLNKDSLGLLDP